MPLMMMRSAVMGPPHARVPPIIAGSCSGSSSSHGTPCDPRAAGRPACVSWPGRDLRQRGSSRSRGRTCPRLPSRLVDGRRRTREGSIHRASTSASDDTGRQGHGRRRSRAAEKATVQNSAVAYRLARTGARKDDDADDGVEPRNLREKKELETRYADGRRREQEAAAAADDEPGENEGEEDFMGFIEDWELEMVRFWRGWNGEWCQAHPVRDSDIKRLVQMGRTDAAFSRPDIVAAGAKKISSLLPDAHVPNMLQRQPDIVHLNFARASQSILELQSVLCSADHCSDVTGIMERYPKLLLCDNVEAEVEWAKARLQELAPECDAALAVKEYPELIYRIKNYSDYAELPMSIQNIILETSVVSEEQMFAAEEYEAAWDAYDREHGMTCEGYSEKGLGAGDFMNGQKPT